MSDYNTWENRADTIMRLRPELIRDLVDHLDHTDRQELAHAADRLTQAAAWLSEYLEWRGAAGCGDHGHTEAADKARDKLRKIRKAIGYTHP